jgi:O-antigen ligase
MTYLQVLSDLGVFGFIAYAGVLLYPICLALKNFIKSGFLMFNELLLPVSVILIYSFSGFFHPVSNEVSEWFVVLVSIAIIMKVAGHVKVRE